MASTILDLMRSFCLRVNQPAPSTIVGVSSPAEQQYLELFRYTGDTLRNKPFNWPQLKRGYVFLTQTDVSRYQLPGDFYRILRGTEWDTSRLYGLSGPTSDFQFSNNVYNVLDLSNYRVFRIVGPTAHLVSATPFSQRSAGVFEIDSAGVNNTDEFYFGYLSCNWLWPRDWVASTAYVVGNIRSVDGYIYICTGNGTSGTVRPTTATSGVNITDGSVTWRVYNEPYRCAPDNTNLNDADICLFDEDIMIEGMVWRFKQLKGQDYQQYRVDWESMVASAHGRFNGPKIGNMAGCEDGYFLNVPEGSWPA